MSDAIDYIALQKSKGIQYMTAQIMDEAHQNNLTLGQSVELAIKRGMEHQENVDKAFRQFQGACITGKEGLGWSGFHDSEELPLDETGLPYYGITKSIRN